MRRTATFMSKEIAQQLIWKAVERAEMSGVARVLAVNEWDFDSEVTLTVHLCETESELNECLRELEAKRAAEEKAREG